MARRRLFGETQKRRKKKSTQALKRQQHVQRVSHTQQPAPFERDTAFDRQDVEFLAAMWDMGVRVQPRRTASPARQEAERTLHFRHDAAEQERLARAMAELAVSPLGAAGARGKPGESAPAGKPAKDPADDSPAAPAQDAAAASAPASRRAEQTPTPPAGRPDAAGQAPHRRGEPEPLTWEEDDVDLMAQALAAAAELGDTAAHREHKYDGAPPPPLPRQPRRPQPLPEHPDTEVDLHGKTQEEAIHIVQNLLLSSFRQGLRHVLIITGQGHNSGDAGPVLRQAVHHWLERNGELYAESFDWAPKAHGGAGAIWVVLRPWQASERT